ncbi:TonB family protein [Undibacterium cyanobacteriorum]|uniref:Protein TonB n=1 Tax=Undibacterium cyanobacteriorum TaxID=3073561 RepID=A0ABY9RFF2_9BURK|nr:TonB family protein [Undibacterium sp. 20NA77.5]WMW79952.1 TonB family protein [Undibacterium sp. 20NA77.5]
MNYALPKAQSPRQFATIGGIIVGHVLVLGAFLAAPSVHFKSAPKETILVMVPTLKPLSPIAPPQATKSQEKPISSPAVEVPSQTITNKIEVKDAIQVSSPAVTVAETTPPVNATANVSITSTAKHEQQGPKVIGAVEYIQAPQADYPAMAKRMGEEGRVVMQVLVNDKGRAEKVEVIKSSGFNRLDESAKTALMRAIFKPYIEDGKTMTVLATASINFSLRG